MTKSETQLTLQKAIERFAGKKCKEFEPHCFACMAWEVLPSWLENEHNTLFTQALTSLKREMEKKKKAMPEHFKQDVYATDRFQLAAHNKAISECQKLLEDKLNGGTQRG